VLFILEEQEEVKAGLEKRLEEGFLEQEEDLQ
jgi:hypothetical protein